MQGLKAHRRHAVRSRFVGLSLLAFACTALPLHVGCGTEPPPTFRQPECEPPDELVIERHLKEAFRFAYEDKLNESLAAFDKVLAIEPAHPEARAGRRAVRASLASPAPMPRRKGSRPQ